MGPALEANINMSDTLHFPKLNGSNYDSWATSMKSALQSCFLWLYVNGEEDMPTVVKSTPPSADRTSTEYQSRKKDREQYKTWLRMDSAAIELLNGSINFTQSDHVANLSTSKEIQDTLYQINVKDQQSLNVYALVKEIWSMNQDGVIPIPNHIGRIIDICHWIVEGKGTIDDMMLVYAIFCSLPNDNVEWDVLKMSLIEKGSSLTLSQATMSLNGLYDCMTRNKGKTEHLALVAKSQGASNHGNTAGKKKKFKKKTFNPKPDDICRTCGQKGHWSPTCPQKGKKGSSSGGSGGGSANLAIESSQSVGDNREVGMVWMAMNNTSLGLRGLLLDSGVFSHMFSKRERFISYTEANDGQLVTVSGLNHTPVVGHRSVSFRAKLPSSLITLVILQNVLHVPSLGANLVSLGVLQCKGASYSSQTDGVIVRGHLG